MQVSEKERTHNLAAMQREIATVVSVLCVNPETRRPHPVSMIESAIKQLHYSIKPNKTAKQQVPSYNSMRSAEYDFYNHYCGKKKLQYKRNQILKI